MTEKVLAEYRGIQHRIGYFGSRPGLTQNYSLALHIIERVPYQYSDHILG